MEGEQLGTWITSTAGARLRRGPVVGSGWVWLGVVGPGLVPEFHGSRSVSTPIEQQTMPEEPSAR